MRGFFWYTLRDSGWEQVRLTKSVGPLMIHFPWANSFKSCPYWASSNLWASLGFPTSAMVPSKAPVVSTGLFNFKGNGLLCDLSVLKKLGDFSVDFKFICCQVGMAISKLFTCHTKTRSLHFKKRFSTPQA